MKYWAYINNEVLGPYEKEELIRLPQFTNSTLLCPQSPAGEKTYDWQEAASFPEISALISNTSARSMATNPTDSGFNNPFHNFGNIDIKSIDDSILLHPASQTREQGFMDPISLSQIARRQENLYNKEENNKISQERFQTGDKEKANEAPAETERESNDILMPKIDLPEITPLSANQSLSKETLPTDIPPADISNTELPQSNIAINNLSDNSTSLDLKPLPETTPLNSGSNLSGEHSILTGSNSSEITPSDKDSDSSKNSQPSDFSLPDLSNSGIPDSVSLPDGLSFPTQSGVAFSTSDLNVSDNLSAEKSSDFLLKDGNLKSRLILNEGPVLAENAKQIQNDDFSHIEEPDKKLDDINRDTEKILALIEKFVSNSASKDDLSSLRTYLDSKIEVLENRINSFDLGEINSSLKNIEGKISSIEKKLDSSISNSKATAVSAPLVEIEKKYDNAVISRQEAPLTQDFPPHTANDSQNKKNESQQAPVAPVEKKKIDPGPVFKTVMKISLSFILVAGIAVAVSLALRNAGVVDLTVYMPFISTAREAKNEASDKTAVTPPLVSNSAQDVEVSANVAASPSTEDLSEEVIYFVRTYIKKGGDKMMENIIIDHAQKNNLDSRAITWKATKMTDEIYNVFAEFPGEQMPVRYLFEVDYKNKKIKPSNDLAGYILGSSDSSMDETKPSMDNKTARKNSIQKRTKSSTMKKKVASKSKVKQTDIKSKDNDVKPAVVQGDKAKSEKNEKESETSENEEYVYEYEDDGEQEYLMPGIPKK